MEKIKECKICKKLKSNEVYKVEGTWLELEIKKIHGETKIQAYGDGIVEMSINYCPMCGERLEERT